MVFGEEEAGRFCGGVCETIVVRRDAELILVDSVVGEARCPGTESNVVADEPF